MARRLTSPSPASSSPPPVKRRGGHTAPVAASLDAFVSDVYLPHVRFRKRSWQVDERIARQHLSPVFGDRRFVDISRTKVESWLHGLAVQGLAPATCNRILAVFKSVCSLAARHGLLLAGQSPCTGVLPFKIHTQRDRYLTQDEARRLMRELERSSRQEATALRLLLLTGGRKNEILKARWEHVRSDLRLLIVPLSKSGKPRHIPLSDEAMAAIRSIRRRPGCPWLFPGHAPGKPLSDIYTFWNGLRRKLDLANVRVHDLRHTFASLLVNAGHSLYEVQKLLGHSDPRTTMRYAHLGQASLVAAAETVSDFLARPGRRSTAGSGGRFVPPSRGPAGEPVGQGRPSHGRAEAKKGEKREKLKKGNPELLWPFLNGSGFSRLHAVANWLQLDRRTVDFSWHKRR